MIRTRNTLIGKRGPNGVASAAPPAAPVNTVAPVISGTSPYYVGATLTTTDGTWNGSPSPSFTYQWRNGGVDISGATANTYVILNADQGDTIDCVVTGTNGSGSASADSNDLVMFIVTQIANNALWLDAADTATITHALGLVSQWDDKSGNGYHATQSSDTSKPITGTRTINSLNTLDFDGSNDKMLLPSGLYTISQSGNTLLVLCATDTAAKADQYMISGTNSGSSRYRLAYDASGTALEVLNGTSASTGAYTVDTSAHAHSLYRSGTGISGGVDGTQYVSNTNATNVSSDALAIGTQANNVFGAYDGRVGEIIWYARSLTNSEMNQVGNYLAAKWGFTWTNV